jgi:hypothetical protein
MSKGISVIISVFIILVFSSVIFANTGQHIGERRMLDVNINFYDSKGKTVTNSQGIYYHHSGRVKYEPKVYPSRYWGTYPLYFFGGRVGVKVTVANKGPRAKIKLRITSEANVILVSGDIGASIMQPKTTQFTVAKGQTKTIDVSFVTQPTPDVDSGLDLFTVKVQHANQGGGPGNEYPALIMVKEGVFCPPKYQD